jgi:hypothetical protein
MRRHGWLALVAVVSLAACRSGDRESPNGAAPRATAAATPASSPQPSPSPSPQPSPSASDLRPTPQAVASPAPVPACPPAAARAAPLPDRPRYRLNLNVRPAERVAEGDLTVRFTPDLPTDRLVFRLWPNAPVTAAGGIHLDAGPATIGGSPASSSQPDPTTLVVNVGRSLAAGEAIEVSMPWHLTLAGPVNDRISAAGDSVRMGSFVPLLAWEPGHGWAQDPATSIHGEAAMTPAADFDMTVTVPDGYTVLASGVPDGSGHWSAEAVPDVGVSVGRFALAEATADGKRGQPVRITVGVNAGIAQNPATYAAKVSRVIANESQRFGPYPWPAYTMAVTPGLHGGMEYPGHVMQGPGTIGRSTSHEVAHQWFYALVINNQARDPWLDEALATWGEAGFEKSLASFVRRTIPSDAKGRGGAPMTYWDGHGASYYRGVYVQPAQALAALGPAATVDCALASYVAANAYRIARPGDLLRSLSSVFPDAPAVFARYGLGG